MGRRGMGSGERHGRVRRGGQGRGVEGIRGRGGALGRVEVRERGRGGLGGVERGVCGLVWRSWGGPKIYFG